MNAWITGQTGFQQYMADALAKPDTAAMVRALRAYARPAQLGASLASDEDK